MDTRIQAQNMAYKLWINRSPKACVPPGLGKFRKFPRFSRFQQDVQGKTTLEWGLDFAPKDVINNIEASRTHWEEELV